MSSGEEIRVGRWVGLALAIVVVSGACGWWLATVTAPNYETETTPSTPGAPKTAAAPANGQVVPAFEVPDPPLYLYARTHRGADLDLVADEIRMAVRAGITNLIISTALPWREDEALEDLKSQLATIEGLSGEARVIVEVELDPSPSWLADHAEDAVSVNGVSLPYASVASEAWLTEVTERLGTLTASLSEHPSVAGVLLACLEGGEWRLPDPYDHSAANVNGFRKWLAETYTNDSALQQAWGDAEISLAEAAIPGAQEATAGAWTDYNRYLSDMNVAAIEACASAVKDGNPEFEVWTRYGYTFSANHAGSGHFALGRLLESAVDTIVYPMAAIERGLGGVGGYAGPIQSIAAHGKRCVLIDDTITGLAKNAETGELERVRGMSYETVSQVHYRNFASALAQGIGVAWADPEGDGRLHDPELWEQFSHMKTTYRDWYARRHGLDSDAATEFPPSRAALAIVVDEQSRESDREDIQTPLIASIVSAAMRAGVPVELWLLDDYVARSTATVSAAIFANCFELDEEERASIHNRLGENGGAAIWLYAPGADGPSADAAENVSNTVRMTVHALEESAMSGSTYALDSYWIRAGETFAGNTAPSPRFYIDDANADVLATYAEGGSASVALTTTPEGWASVFIGEARLTPELLHEVLHLLDVPTVSRNYGTRPDNAYYVGPSVLGLHTGDAAEVNLDFGLTFDITDGIDPNQGWLAKSALTLHADDHETRLLIITPSTFADAQADAVDDVPAESGASVPVDDP